MAALKRLSIMPSYGQKVVLLASLPLMLAVLAISIVVTYQYRQLSEREIDFLEQTLLEAKQAELHNYMSLARNAIYHIYGLAGPEDEEAKLRATQILSAMTFGDEGFFFVYEYDGTNLVSSRQTWLINQNWIDMTDSTGTPIVQPLVDLARSGGGYHRYVWPRPSTGQEAEMFSYVIGFQDWQWALGTGIFIDDVLDEVAAARSEIDRRIAQTFAWIAGITLVVLLGMFGFGLMINLRERRLADQKLAILTQRIVDTQEEERARVARELHDGISQLLVGVRFTLDLAQRKLQTGAEQTNDLITRSGDGINTAIQEVRRISRDLRPGALDDLGLSPALKTLAEEFAERTAIKTRFDTVALRNSISSEGKTALYRVAQEALTNIERHAGATEVTLTVKPHRKGITLTILDNGSGFRGKRRGQNGIGLRNMSERIDHLGGSFSVKSSASGTIIVASLPERHIVKSVEQDRPTL